MKLSKIYSNHSDLFTPVSFNKSLNIVLGKIQSPQNQKKDTHNLGKSLLCSLINFLLAQKKDKRFFLFEHDKLFKDFIFFLELDIGHNLYLTIRRSVANSSKISLKTADCAGNDYSCLPDQSWDHLNISIDKARSIIDGLLSWKIGGENFRSVLGYLLRTQSDYNDVFQLSKFKGAQSFWKKALSGFIGLNSNSVSSIYDKEEELSALKSQKKIYDEAQNQEKFHSNIEELIVLKDREIQKKQYLLDHFDFRMYDFDKTKEEVEYIDFRISKLNKKRYSLLFNLKKINNILDEKAIAFNSEYARELFEEAGVLFKGQIKKDFDQLIQFNKDITEERNIYLKEEKINIERDLSFVNDELEGLGKKRVEILGYLSNTDIFSKYKYISNELVNLKVELYNLKQERDNQKKISDINAKIALINNSKNIEISCLVKSIKKISDDDHSVYSKIRVYFNDIVNKVINKQAELKVEVNKNGHLDFFARILDKNGISTSEDSGHSYRKLLCVAFDLAFLRAHLNDNYPRFVYHDGIFESLDDRKKINLVNVLREYTNFGIQIIITMIDSELPKIQGNKPFIDKNEIVLTLHDKDDSGRLFKIPSW